MAYRQAIDVTTETIQVRAQRYRDLVVAVALTLTGSSVAALILWSWRPLLALGMVVALYGSYVLVDGRLVLAWQRRLLDFWVYDRLELGALRDALYRFPRMPVRTLSGMFTLLPGPRTSDALGLRAPACRGSVALMMREFHALRHVKSMVVTASYVVAVSCVAVAVARWSALPFLGMIIVPFLPGLNVARGALAEYRWRRQVGHLRDGGLDVDAVMQQLPRAELGSRFAAFVERLREIAEQESGA